MASTVVYESDISGERFEVETPLTSRYDLGELRDDLGLPGHIDLADTQVARFVGIAWAAKHADDLARSDAGMGKPGGPIRVAAFGSVGVRVVSPSANAEGPFKRKLGDVDLITTRGEGQRLVRLLTGLGPALGSRYWHAVTKSDEMFNALRRGRRFRVHGVEEDESGGARASVLDLLTDQIEFCHRIPVEEALQDPESSSFTIDATNLVLAKLQAIQAIERDRLDDRFEYRVVGELGDKLLLGPEAKDLIDASAVLHDAYGREFDPELFARRLSGDWGLAKTVALNLGNPRMFEVVLRERGADEATVEVVLGRVRELSELIEEPRFKPRKPRMRFGKTWWEPVEEHEHD